MATAKIGPTGYNDTYGILWEDFRWVRGGYSGSFQTYEAAAEWAASAAKLYGEPLTIVPIETVNPTN